MATTRPPNNGYQPGWKPIQVYIPQELRDSLKHLAIDERCPVAEIVRAGIESEIARRTGGSKITSSNGQD